MCNSILSSCLIALCLLLSTQVIAQKRDFNFADPMQPFSYSQAPTAEQAARAKLHLQAILTSSREAYAVINNQPVSVGDVVDGYTLVKISGSSVTLGRDTGQDIIMKPYTLTFDPSTRDEQRRNEP